MKGRRRKIILLIKEMEICFQARDATNAREINFKVSRNFFYPQNIFQINPGKLDKNPCHNI